MKFVKNMFRKWEFPSAEKLNSIIEGFNNHIQKKGAVSADPGAGFEHWASAIKCDQYPDVQAALDNPPGEYTDTKTTTYIVAHSDDRQKYNADYYINDLRSLASIGAAGSSHVFFFHNGVYSASVDDENPGITIPRNSIFIGESKEGVTFNVDRCRIQNNGADGGSTAPLVFANMTFKGSFQEIIRGNDYYLYNCNMIYKSSTIHAATGSSFASIGPGLFRTYDMGDGFPLESKLEKVTFKILYPGAPGSGTNRYYEYVKAIQHEYYRLLVKNCTIDYFGGDTILFHRGIYSNPDASGILKIVDSKIVTYNETVYGSSGQVLIDRSKFGRLNT